MRWLFLIVLLWPAMALGQGTATLVADRVTVEDGARLVASGNVEAFYDGTRLSAAQVIYDQSTDRLEILGPIFIETPDGAILTADRAQLDPKLESGMLRGARLVLSRQLQLGANRIDRRDGRYNQLYRTAVTSCQVCGTRAPLWDIRAERVVHDEEEQQLYFTNAILRVRGFPVFWLPRARLPDPTLERSTGFLIPSIRTTDQLGTGIRLPYFIAIGDHRDLTLTPYLSNRTRTLEARYRQAFLAGDLQIDAAFTDDQLEEKSRAYIFADGTFDLARGFKLDFNIESTSDPAYLLDYGFSDADRLESSLSISRVASDELVFGNLSYFDSLRDDEVDAELPPIVGDFLLERRVTGLSGGALTYAISGDMLYRWGNGTGDTGRDMLRLGAATDWKRSWVSRNGLVLRSRLGATADLYKIWDDADYEAPLARVVPHAQLILGYPLHKQTDQARHLLEPAVAITWSAIEGDNPPNEDSTRPEFDTGNLFALNQFPGNDAVEDGFRATAGLSWTRHGKNGAQTRLTFGRLIREQSNDDYTLSSGLSGLQSDWLIAGQHETGRGLRFEGRALLDNSFDFTSAAAKVGWSTDDIDIGASYIWQAPDSEIGLDAAAAAWTLDSRIQLEEAWAVEFGTRYDVSSDTPTRAALGIEWRNECVTVDLSVSRRYTSTTTVAPSTDYGLSVSLTGFSAGRSAGGPLSGCNNT